MKKLSASLILIMCGVLLYGQGVEKKTDATSQEIKNVLTEYQKTWEYNFKAEMKSTKIKEKLENEIFKLAPLSLKIKKMFFVYDGKGRLEIELYSLPPELKEKIERKVKEIIEKSDVNAIYQDMTYLMLRQIIDILLTRESFDIININTKALDFEVSDLDETLRQKKIESVRIWINRKEKSIGKIKFNFKEDQYIIIEFKYKLLNIPEKNVRIYFPDELSIEQNAFLKNQNAPMDFPKNFDIKYTDFIFGK